MPFIVDPAKDKSNGVGNIFRTINITLAIALPLSALLLAISWGLKHGLSSFILFQWIPHCLTKYCFNLFIFPSYN